MYIERFQYVCSEFDVQNGFVFKSFSFEHHCVEESNEICIKMLTNDTAILVPMAVRCVWK